MIANTAMPKLQAPIAHNIRLALVLLAACVEPMEAQANLHNDSIMGSVRRASDPVGTNYFFSPNAVVGLPLEFSGIDGDYEIRADLQSSNFVNITVDRIPEDTNATPPHYRFTFSDLDFSTPSIITGLTRLGGTPGIDFYDVLIGPDSAEFTIESTFLANGGSLGISVRFDRVAVPEPPAVLFGGAVVALLGIIAAAARCWPVRCGGRDTPANGWHHVEQRLDCSCHSSGIFSGADPDARRVSSRPPGESLEAGQITSVAFTHVRCALPARR